MQLKQPRRLIWFDRLVPEMSEVDYTLRSGLPSAP